MANKRSEKWSSEMVELARLADERGNLEVKIVCQVRRVCAEGGSWANVGTALGLTGQAAWSRYGPSGPMTEQARAGTQGKLGFEGLTDSLGRRRGNQRDSERDDQAQN